MSEEQIKEIEEQILKLYEICLALGWCVAINESTEMTRGMIIGKHDYILEVMSNLEGFENYTILDIIEPPAPEEIH